MEDSEILICKMCGYIGRNLTNHLRSTHNYSVYKYRKIFGLGEIVQIGFNPYKEVHRKRNYRASNIVKKSYRKIKRTLDSYDIIEYDKLKKFLFEYGKLFYGRTKYRTMIKLYPSEYKSVLHYTTDILNSNKLKFSLEYRIRFILEHDCNLNNIKCQCGMKYTMSKRCRHCRPANADIPKVVSEETKQKIRESTIRHIQNSKGQCAPRYNANSIRIIEQVASKLNITDLKHAENGGEYCVCGYFLDGYSPSKNIVIEFNEKHHYDKHGNLKLRDLTRERIITNKLGCKFIHLKYSDYEQV